MTQQRSRHSSFNVDTYGNGRCRVISHANEGDVRDLGAAFSGLPKSDGSVAQRPSQQAPMCMPEPNLRWRLTHCRRCREKPRDAIMSTMRPFSSLDVVVGHPGHPLNTKRPSFVDHRLVQGRWRLTKPVASPHGAMLIKPCTPHSEGGRDGFGHRSLLGTHQGFKDRCRGS